MVDFSNNNILFDTVINKLLESNSNNGMVIYPVQVPPESREECIELCRRAGLDKEEWNLNDKPASFEEAMKQASDDVVKHEAVHAMQTLYIPNIYKGLQNLTHKETSSEEEKSKNYFIRPPEIMAYAYDTAKGVDREDNLKKYNKIGGDVLKQFNHYLKEYLKRVK